VAMANDPTANPAALRAFFRTQWTSSDDNLQKDHQQLITDHLCFSVPRTCLPLL
jgi:hypothetical protein